MRVVFDCKLRRPGCAIVQAVLGGDLGIANHFNSDVWLTHTTPDMRCYEVTEDQLKQLVAMTEDVTA